MKHDMERTVELTPSWRGVLHLLLAVYTDGSASARADVIAELERMADLADLYVEISEVIQEKRPN